MKKIKRTLYHASWHYSLRQHEEKHICDLYLFTWEFPYAYIGPVCAQCVIVLDVQCAMQTYIIMSRDYFFYFSSRSETVNDVWIQFTRCLLSALGIITYRPVFTGKNQNPSLLSKPSDSETAKSNKIWPWLGKMHWLFYLLFPAKIRNI